MTVTPREPADRVLSRIDFLLDRLTVGSPQHVIPITPTLRTLLGYGLDYVDPETETYQEIAKLAFADGATLTAVRVALRDLRRIVADTVGGVS